MAFKRIKTAYNPNGFTKKLVIEIAANSREALREVLLEIYEELNDDTIGRYRREDKYSYRAEIHGDT